MSATNDITLDAALSVTWAYIAANPGTGAMQAIDFLVRVHAGLAALVEQNHVTVGAGMPEHATLVDTQDSRQKCMQVSLDVRPITVSRIPALAVEDSISADGEYIYCLADGARLKMLRRYIKRFGFMSVDSYREHYGLDPSYPQTSPNYVAQKRREAIKNRLGTHENKAMGRQRHQQELAEISAQADAEVQPAMVMT